MFNFLQSCHLLVEYHFRAQRVQGQGLKLDQKVKLVQNQKICM